MTNNNNTYEQPRLQLPLPAISPLEPAKKKHKNNDSNQVEDTDDDVRKDFEVDFDVNKENND